MIKIKISITIATYLLFALNALSWGQKGHDTVAYIAECNLTQAAKDSVSSILDGKSMVYFANWADNACHTEPYAYTRTWHYKNVNEGVNYKDAKSIKEGDIVTALNKEIAVLGSKSATEEEKWLALVLTTHFLGDIHQPLHLGRATDRGGNYYNIKFFNSGSNLHKVWDEKLPEAAHKWSHTEWQRYIDNAPADSVSAYLEGGTPDKWAEETHSIAVKIYDATPEGHNVNYDYIAEWTPTIELQLLKGGLRLADLLNGIFDSEYSAKNSIGK